MKNLAIGIDLGHLTKSEFGSLETLSERTTGKPSNLVCIA